MKVCIQKERSNTLLYIAHNGWKGQDEFVNMADPSLAAGFTVEFFAPRNAKDTEAELQALAHKRNISAVIRSQPALRQSCLVPCDSRDSCTIMRRGMPTHECRVSRLPVFVTEDSFLCPREDAQSSICVPHKLWECHKDK